MKRILVAGGAGFIGANLCLKLLENPDNYVICLDNEFTGNFCKLQTLKSTNRLQIVKHDIINPLEISENIDYIYNLACPASPRHYQGEAAIYTTKTCILGILNLLEIAKKKNARILQASTSEIYGDPTMHPQKEIYWGHVNPIGIRSCYDEGKRCAESILFDYNRIYGVDIKVVRIFNTYGPFMDCNDGRVISNFICQALNNQDITIYGDGLQTRSFCYISDLVEGLVRMMESNISGPINLGNPDEQSINDIAQLVINISKSSSKLKYLPLPQDDPVRRCPDISKAQKLLHWKPEVKLELGINRTLEYFKNVIL